MVFSTTAPGLSRARGTSECDILRDRPVCRGGAPELHFPRMAGWFRRAGMEKVTARTFAGDVCAPLSGELRDALIALIGMRWGDVGAESPEFIPDLPDYYAFFTYSMFRGRVVG